MKQKRITRALSLVLALALVLGLGGTAFAAGGSYFSDVVPGAWYDDAVTWALNAGVAQGYPDGSFGVGRVCTEEEALVMLWRAAGRVETGSGVRDADKALSWLERQSGVDLDFAQVSGPVTRADFVADLYLALGDLADVPAELPFTDLAALRQQDPSGFYEKALRWAYSKGLVTGVSATEFAPEREMTREQVVTLLWRCFETELPYTVTRRELPLYILSPAQSVPMQVYYIDGQTDIPYLSAQDVADLMMNMFSGGNPDGYSVTVRAADDRVLLMRENGYPMILDFDTDTISFLDYDAFLTFASDGPAIQRTRRDLRTEDAEGNPMYFQVLDTSSDRYGRALTMNLGAYGLRLIRQGDGYYIPFQTVNDLLFGMVEANILYNGECFMVNPDAELTEQFYSVPTGERSPALALFTYKELCFALDQFYGLKDQHNIRSFTEEFKMNGLKYALLSTDPAEADEALSKLLFYYLDDLHSGFGAPSYLEGPEHSWELQIGASVGGYLAARKRFSAARAAAYPEGVPGYQEVGDTAYITFDEFTYDLTDYYQTPPDENTTDTMGLMIYAYSRITRPGSPIQNVVLDLSMNGGGVVAAAAYVIGAYLGQTSISMRNTLTDALATENCLVDLNLDRVFDEKDSLSDYNLYCLISPVSFSCGNLVPSVFQSSHRVTLLGQTSGGGACEVHAMTTADGAQFNISSPYSLSFLKNGSFYDIDQGVAPDYVISNPAHFYDRAALTEYIHGLF